MAVGTHDITLRSFFEDGFLGPCPSSESNLKLFGGWVSVVEDETFVVFVATGNAASTSFVFSEPRDHFISSFDCSVLLVTTMGIGIFPVMLSQASLPLL